MWNNKKSQIKQFKKKLLNEQQQQVTFTKLYFVTNKINISQFTLDYNNIIINVLLLIGFAIILFNPRNTLFRRSLKPIRRTSEYKI